MEFAFQSPEGQGRGVSNLPRDKLLEHAAEAVRRMGAGEFNVHFKFTCRNCGARVTLEEPNKLYERGECCECGHEQRIDEGGYAIVRRGLIS